MELLTVIIIIGIVAAMAAPRVDASIKHWRTQQAVSTVTNALKDARAESLIRHQNVRVEYDAAAHAIKTVLPNQNNKPIASATLPENIKIEHSAAKAGQANNIIEFNANKSATVANFNVTCCKKTDGSFERYGIGYAVAVGPTGTVTTTNDRP